MGSMIHLAVGRLEIDWGKNFGFTDHSPLFQVTDLAQVPYYYAEGKGETYIDSTGEERSKLIVKLKEGMSKPLGQVVDRIALLGHTLAHCALDARRPGFAIRSDRSHISGFWEDNTMNRRLLLVGAAVGLFTTIAIGPMPAAATPAAATPCTN